MAEYLVFSLAAPMGAFGDLAGHERRGSGLWPGRSAILGLIGAALGVRRGDATGQAALDPWRMAVAALHVGMALRDYHTAQTVPSVIKRPNSRREALAEARRKGSLNTILTSRDYLTDCVFAVALWGGPDAPALRRALKMPVFVPYLGRKSCPLAAPMAPRLVEAATPVAALAGAQLPPWLPAARPQIIVSDAFAGLAGREETRWDQPLDRSAWHFAPRTIHILAPEGQP